jgi:hypothetical protein
MRFLAVLTLMLASAVARADDFGVLAKQGATWTYEVTKGAKHKPTGAKVTVTVSKVHTAGPYTVVELDMNPAETEGVPSVPAALIIGPDGVHSAPFFLGGEATDAERYGLDNVKGTYTDHYAPYGTIPTLKKGKQHLKLDRFGDDDCEYNVHVAITEPKGKPWHIAWTGTCLVPESGEKDSADSSIDYDPAVGITMICNGGICLRAVP